MAWAMTESCKVGWLSVNSRLIELVKRLQLRWPLAMQPQTLQARNCCCRISFSTLPEMAVAARSSIEQAEAKALEACNKKARQICRHWRSGKLSAVRRRPPLSTARPARFLTEMAANAEGTLGLLEVDEPVACTDIRQRCGADIYDASVQLS